MIFMLKYFLPQPKRNKSPAGTKLISAFLPKSKAPNHSVSTAVIGALLPKKPVHSNHTVSTAIIGAVLPKKPVHSNHTVSNAIIGAVLPRRPVHSEHTVSNAIIGAFLPGQPAHSNHAGSNVAKRDAQRRQTIHSGNKPGATKKEGINEQYAPIDTSSKSRLKKSETVKNRPTDSSAVIQQQVAQMQQLIDEKISSTPGYVSDNEPDLQELKALTYEYAHTLKEKNASRKTPEQLQKITQNFHQESKKIVNNLATQWEHEHSWKPFFKNLLACIVLIGIYSFIHRAVTGRYAFFDANVSSTLNIEVSPNLSLSY